MSEWGWYNEVVDDDSGDNDDSDDGDDDSSGSDGDNNCCNDGEDVYMVMIEGEYDDSDGAIYYSLSPQMTPSTLPIPL